MSDEIDPLKAFEALSINLSTGHVDLFGLKEARAHQRGENVGKPVVIKSKRFSQEQIMDMMDSLVPIEVVAKRNGTNRTSVLSYRRKAGR